MQFEMLDHVVLMVEDLAVSDRFYAHVLGLSSVPRPDFDFAGLWYQIGPNQTLQLIEEDAQADTEPGAQWRGRLALRVSDIQQATEAMQTAGIDFTGPEPRPDGAQQIFFRDPDHHTIELCTVPDNTSEPKLV